MFSCFNPSSSSLLPFPFFFLHIIPVLHFFYHPPFIDSSLFLPTRILLVFCFSSFTACFLPLLLCFCFLFIFHIYWFLSVFCFLLTLGRPLNFSYSPYSFIPFSSFFSCLLHSSFSFLSSPQNTGFVLDLPY